MRTTILKAPLATVGHVACVIGLALTLIFRLETVSGQVPQLVNYTGRVAVGTVNFDGSGQFKFALVNSNGSTTYWSNDGTSTAGSQPTAAVTLTVIKGLYTVLLGDATLANMTAIPASVFTNADVRLRVWFNDGTNGSQLLTPDQRIAAVGYAMMAGNVPDGSITAAKLASNLTLGGATTGTFVASGDSDLQGNILKNPALGMLLLHPSYWQGAKREGTGGQADIIDQDGVIQINSNGSGSYSEVRGNDRIMRTPLDKPGTFISARAGFNSDPSAGKVFYIVAGNGGGFAPPGNGFGFKGIGTALKGVTIANGETVVDLATALAGQTYVSLLAVRRATSVEFYVNGVLKGSSSTNLPTDSTQGYVLRLQNNGPTTDYTPLLVGFLTIGIPMF